MLKVEYVPLDKIIPYVNNPKKHPAEQVKKIASSIREFGFKVPIIVDKNYTIIAGHGRYEAAKRIGLKEVPVIVADDLSPAQVKAFRIADNKVAESEWDLDALAAELAQLKEIDYDLELTGYDEDEIRELIRELEVGEEEIAEEVEDELPEVDEEAEPFSKRGDIWILGRHRVMCGDSTSRADVERLMDGRKADMAFTDPHYNIDYSDLKGKFGKIKNDSMQEEEFKEFLHSSLIYLPKTSYICCNWKSYHLFYEVLREIGLPVKACIVWDKEVRAQNLDKYFKQHEFILYTGKLGGEKTLRGDVWRVKRPRSELHPTMKPISLIEMAILDNPDAEVILDLFGGSGSTLIAAEKTGRTCYMMELDPHYVDVIVWRYIHTTGKKDITLIRDGEEIPFSEIESEFMMRFE